MILAFITLTDIYGKQFILNVSQIELICESSDMYMSFDGMQAEKILCIKEWMEKASGVIVMASGNIIGCRETKDIIEHKFRTLTRETNAE